jgi:hypothetical protein
MTATDQPAEDRDDSIVYWIFAAIALFFAALLGREMYLHHLPFTVGLFAGLSSFTGVYMGLGHLWAGWQRAQTTVAEDQSTEH